MKSAYQFSLKTTNVNLLVALEEKQDQGKVGDIHPLDTMNICTFLA